MAGQPPPRMPGWRSARSRGSWHLPLSEEPGTDAGNDNAFAGVIPRLREVMDAHGDGDELLWYSPRDAGTDPTDREDYFGLAGPISPRRSPRGQRSRPSSAADGTSPSGCDDALTPERSVQAATNEGYGFTAPFTPLGWTSKCVCGAVPKASPVSPV